MIGFRTLRFPTAAFLAAALIFSLLTIAGCGSTNMNRVLQSMTVSPATADAQNFTYGQVAFAATGVYNTPPSPATVSAAWDSMNTNIATVDQSGVAKCVAGANGPVTIEAKAASSSAIDPGEMPTTAVVATATLTCP